MALLALALSQVDFPVPRGPRRKKLPARLQMYRGFTSMNAIYVTWSLRVNRAFATRVATFGPEVAAREAKEGGGKGTTDPRRRGF